MPYGNAVLPQDFYYFICKLPVQAGMRKEYFFRVRKHIVVR